MGTKWGQRMAGWWRWIRRLVSAPGSALKAAVRFAAGWWRRWRGWISGAGAVRVAVVRAVGVAALVAVFAVASLWVLAPWVRSRTGFDPGAFLAERPAVDALPRQASTEDGAPGSGGGRTPRAADPSGGPVAASAPAPPVLALGALEPSAPSPGAAAGASAPASPVPAVPPASGAAAEAPPLPQVLQAQASQEATKAGELAEGPLAFTLPVASGTVVRTRGWHRHPVYREWRFQPGMELDVPPGTPVRAVLPGAVRFVGQDGRWGLMVRLEHGGGWQTAYGFLREVALREGQQVAAGGTVGFSGTTPWGEPRLFFGVWKDGAPQDPLLLMPF